MGISKTILSLGGANVNLESNTNVIANRVEIADNGKIVIDDTSSIN